jgi:hypothetical protein
MDAPGPVVEAAIRRIVERQEAKEKQQQTRDDAEAWSRMHEQLQRGG